MKVSEMSYAGRARDPIAEGVVGRLSQGGWTHYHRLGCADAPGRGQPGVRDVVHGPWRYLAAHWRPCPACRPPGSSQELAA